MPSVLPHYLAKFRSLSFGISGRKCKWKCNIHWFIEHTPNFNTLSFLTYFYFNFCFLLNIFCKQQTMLSKQVTAFSACLAWQWPAHHWQCNNEWRGRLRVCMRAKGGHFEQLLWHYSVIRQETFQFVKYDHVLIVFFLEIATNLNF